jgi:L-iditol 2-dehydrogenase
LHSVERGGKVLLFAPTDPGVATPISLNEVFWRTDVTLTTSYGATPYDYQTAVDIIRASPIPVRPMITHRLPPAEAGLAFHLVAAADDSIKVIIELQK